MIEKVEETRYETGLYYVLDDVADKLNEVIDFLNKKRIK